MNHLAFELLNKIFLLLHQQDKVECMSVCQKWKHTIENHCLFTTVRVGSMPQMINLIDKVKKNPIQGTKVEILILDVNLSGFEMDFLPVLFPNLRYFLDFEIYARNRIPFTEKLTPHHPWKNHIEHMTECYYDESIYQTLASGLCSRLTKISTFGMSRFHDSSFVALLENAPALETLYLHSCKFDLMDLDLLHKNSPNLKSFSCHFFYINCKIVPSNIIPAPSMRTFLLTLVRPFIIQDEINMFQYLYKKYPNLSEFSYGASSMERTDLEVERLYHSGLVPFMEGIGTQLRSFSLDWEHATPSIYKLLDDCHCRLREYTIKSTLITQYEINQLVQSTQARFLRSLTVTNLIDDACLTLLKDRLECLEELNIKLSFQLDATQRPTINISPIFNTFGRSLKTLMVSNVLLAFDNAAPPLEYPLLQHLYFTKANFPRQIDHFISTSFPNLRILKARQCDWHQTLFNLPNIDLFSLEIIKRFPEEHKSILVKTLKDNQQRWYSAKSIHNAAYSITRTDSSDNLLYPAMMSTPFEPSCGTPFMTVVLKSLYDFRMVNGSD